MIIFFLIKSISKMRHSSVVLEVFPDYGMFMLHNPLMEVTARLIYIICFAQIAFKFIDYVLLVN